jgi:hypothetical protein
MEVHIRRQLFDGVDLTLGFTLIHQADDHYGRQQVSGQTPHTPSIEGNPQ